MRVCVSASTNLRLTVAGADVYKLLFYIAACRIHRCLSGSEQGSLSSDSRFAFSNVACFSQDPDMSFIFFALTGLSHYTLTRFHHYCDMSRTFYSQIYSQDSPPLLSHAFIITVTCLSQFTLTFTHRTITLLSHAFIIILSHVSHMFYSHIYSHEA